MSQNIIPSDNQAQLTAALSALDKQAIIRPNDPPPGIAGFLFDIRGEESAEVSSEITDHYVEDNTAIQDQVALKPEIITVRGMVAELTNANYQYQPRNAPADPLPANAPMVPVPSPGTLASLVKNVIAKNVTNAALQIIGGTKPKDAIRGIINTTKSQAIAGVKNKINNVITTSVTSAISNVKNMAISTLLQPASVKALLSPRTLLPTITQNAVGALKSLVPKALGKIIGAIKKPKTPAAQQTLAGASTTNTDDVNSLFLAYIAKQQTPPDLSRQTSAYLYFYGLWKTRALFSVETPWGIWNDMVIQSMNATQPEETKSATDFTLVFKKIRTAQSVTSQSGQLAGRLVAQTAASEPAQNGTVGQTKLSDGQKQTLLRRFAENLVGTP